MEKIESKIVEARAARMAFLEAVLRSGIFVNPERKKIEKAAREAFIISRADVWNAAEFEHGGEFASKLVDMLDAREWSGDAVFHATELLQIGGKQAA